MQINKKAENKEDKHKSREVIFVVERKLLKMTSQTQQKIKKNAKINFGSRGIIQLNHVKFLKLPLRIYFSL